jgi:hypothetical protein
MTSPTLLFTPFPRNKRLGGDWIKRRGKTFYSISTNVVYYESIKREIKIKPISECRCDERLKIKTEDLHVSHTLV